MNKILYSGKVWWEESLANLVNEEQFTKLKPSKSSVVIITYWLDQSIHQTFPHQNFVRANSPNFPTIQYIILYHETGTEFKSNKRSIHSHELQVPDRMQTDANNHMLHF